MWRIHLLTSVYCPFHLLTSFKDGGHRSKMYFIILSDTHTHYASVSELACMRVWIMMHTPPSPLYALPPLLPCQVLPRFLYLDCSSYLSSPFSATYVKNYGPYFPLPKYIFNITFPVFFSKIFRHLASWPWDPSAAHSAQWQDLELIFGRLFTT